MALTISKFDKSYYQTGNYKNYLSRQPIYDVLSKELSSHIRPVENIIDYGCGVGFLIEGLKKQQYNNICGYEISSWAIQELHKKNISLANPGNYDTMICLDVLEHMTDEQIHQMMNLFSAPKLIVRIPVSEDDIDYHLDISKNDPTHINCKTKIQWINSLNKFGYKETHRLNYTKIYDSIGVLCAILEKD